jgi:hypothetical protein
LLDSSPLEDELEEPVPLDVDPLDVEPLEDSLLDGELELVEGSVPVLVPEDSELVDAPELVEVPLELAEAAFSAAARLAAVLAATVLDAVALFFADRAGSWPEASWT